MVLSMEINEAKEMLSELGLSTWEIDAYVALVKHGPQTAVELSRLTSVARSKTYEVITRLRRKGLVIKVPPMPAKGVTQKFVVNDPQNVFPSKIEQIKNLTKYLTDSYNNPLKPRYPDMSFYTTKETARKFLLRTTKESKYIYATIGNKDLKHILSFSFEQMIQNIEKKTHQYIIASTLHDFSKNITNAKYLEKIQGINYIITPESVILDLWESQHIILELKSKEAVQTFKAQFMQLVH